MLQMKKIFNIFRDISFIERLFNYIIFFIAYLIIIEITIEDHN